MSFAVDFAPGAGPFDVIGQHYLKLTGGAGSASTPDAASLDIVGDIEITVEITLEDTVPTSNPALVSKWTAAGNQRSYIFWMSDGRLAFSWSTDGTFANSHSLVATAALPITTGRIAVRASFDADLLGVSHNVAFYSAPSIGGSFTQVGGLVSDTGTTSIFSGTAPLLVGNVGATEASKPMIGRAHAMELRNAIGGTIVANPNFAAQAAGTTSFADTATPAKTWTINAPATLVAFDWVDLSSRLVEATWSEGRDDELEHYEPGEATIVLRNEDRALDPDHSGGPWFGKLRPRTPFRIRELGTTPEDRFYGFVESGFEQGYEPPRTATCTVELTDRLSAVAGVLNDVFEHALLSRGPVACWMLDSDSDAEQVADRSGNGHDGTVSGAVTFGEPPVMPGHGPSARFDAVALDEFGRIDISRSPLVPATGEVSVVATFKARRVATLNFRDLFQQHNGTNPGTGFAANIDLTGRPQFAWVLNGGGIGYEVARSVVDGEGHILFGQSNGIALDTAVLSTATTSVVTGTPNGVGIGGVAGIQPEDHWDGWICAIAVYDRLLSPADRELILEGHTYLNGRRSDEHIGWALDRVGVPVEHRKLDQGTVLMGPADAHGKDALEFIREVVATEQGEFYVDHRDGGKLRFRHRYARFLDTRSTASQDEFSDLPTGVGIQVDGLEVAPNGIDGIVNQVTVSWRDGEVMVEDPGSVAAYGPQRRTVDTQATTAAQARSVGEWLVARYAQPRSRVRGIETRPDASAKALAAARELQVGDRVTYRFRPQNVGLATLTHLFVEGIEQSLTEGTVRAANYRLAPVDTFDPWIWGTSDWDFTTVWG